MAALSTCDSQARVMQNTAEQSNKHGQRERVLLTISFGGRAQGTDTLRLCSADMVAG
jgi:hypothetical protein